MSDAPIVPPAAEAQGRRTHPLTGVVQGTLWAAAAMVGLVGSMLGDGWGMHPLLSLAAAVVGSLLVGITVGWIGWRFTRYVIDTTELRIDSGILTRTSRRIPFERIQSVDVAEPLVARLFGLAELRVEMAGGSESRTSLRYLTLDDTQRLRRLLLARAHGADGTDVGPDASRTVIAAVPPERVVIGTVLSLDFLAAAVGALGVVVLAVWFVGVLALLGGIIPLVTWLTQIIAGRVVQQWGFTLSRGERGLRIERGLLSRTSQTIPFDRVQGVAVKEPFVWRRLGWQRLEVDVAGYATAGDTSEGGTDTSSTLLPIGDPALALHVTRELLPEAAPDDVPRVAASPRGRIFAPVGWRYRWAGADDHHFVARTGWVQRTTSIVPHHKTQSVELRQGPLQRLRGVATIEVHTPRGPVDADGRHLEAEAARRLALEQLDRARAARG